MVKSILGAAAVIVVVILIAMGVDRIVESWHDHTCARLNAHAVTTSGNGGFICVDSDGKIVGP